MNAPNRYELYILQDGEKALEVIEDTKIPNAATIKVVKQDHTIANMVRAQLLSNPNVIFAGYKVPHPLEPYFIIKIQTDGSITPTAAFQSACNTLLATLVNLQKEFDQEFSYKEVVHESGTTAATTAQPYGGMDYSGMPGMQSRMRAHDYADF